jgi:hypothetical protein
MTTIEKLTDKKFQEIFENEKFRNEVAFAHVCESKEGHFLHFKTCAWPKEYIVTLDQIHAAAECRKLAKIETIRKHKNDLIFVAMGSDYSPAYEDDVCNFRIRTEFKNKEGHLFFIEFSKGLKDNLCIDFSIDRDKQIELNDSHLRQNEFYNYKNLQREKLNLKYTKENVLNVVNTYFNCCFKTVIVDSFNLSCDDLICESPKN